MKLAPISADSLIRLLKKLGFIEVRQRGSHIYLKHSDGRATVVPVHKGRDVGRGLLKKILNEYRNAKGRISYLPVIKRMAVS